MRARLNNIFFLLFDCKSRKQHQQVAWLGNLEIFSVAQGQMLVASGDRALLEHSLGYC